VLAALLVALGLALGGAAGGATAGADQTVAHDAPGSSQQVSFIGDSTLTGVRWYADYGALTRWDFVFDAESCRRTIEQSCISREGYRSENVLATMQRLDGRLGDVHTVMSGYNDPLWTIDEAIAGGVDVARRQDVEHVVWLTLRTSDDVDYSDPQEQTSINTFREYNEQLVEAAAASDGYLQVADWATYSNGASGWFEYDGVHLTPRGVDALTGFLAGTVEQVLAGKNVSPAAAPWTVLVPGAEGDLVADLQATLLDAGIDVPGGADGVFGNDTMAAVAAYQRNVDGLQVTGAVDVDTARSLGILDEPSDDPGDAAGPQGAAGATAGAGDAVAAVTAPVGSAEAEPTSRSGSPLAVSAGGGVSWWLVAAASFVLLVVAVVARRRYVVAQRRARRWARVHPATSPHRSVADLRRAGRLPAPSRSSAPDRTLADERTPADDRADHEPAPR
jgi:hypothetical protein